MRLPNDSQRITIYGKTGTGKTRAAVWHLSQRRFDVRPWIVLNHKGEELIDSIEGAQHVELDFVPKKAGIYIFHPIPEVDDEAVTSLLWKIHARENCGIYIDEGYMLPARDPAFQAILTQGRSKKIPLITLTQRPVWVTRFAISEADFHQVFYLQDKDDRKRVNSFIPADLERWMRTEVNQPPKLPEFHSLYYDVGKNHLNMLLPVPDDSILLATIEARLKPKNKKYLL